MSIISKVKTVCRLVKFSLLEKTFEKRLKYLYYRANSDILLVVFSAFPPTDKMRVYNYLKSFQNLNIDRLYIKDTFGYKGSYYLYDKGDTYPQVLCSSLIEKMMTRGGYKTLITAGTSKGGTSAIYFGLKHHAKTIFAGACQYHIGNYLNTEAHQNILKGMIGDDVTDRRIDALNRIMPEAIRQNAGANTVIHIVYSKHEHTYEDDIVDLLQDLQNYQIRAVEKEEYFTNHNDVGYYFAPYVVNTLETIL